MIKNLYLNSSIFAIIVIGCAVLMTHSPKIYAGIAFGYVIGIIPFASWHWILHKTRGFTVPGNRLLIVGVISGKFAIIIASFYIIISNKLLNTLAILGGMFIVFVILVSLVGIKALFNKAN